MQAATVYMQDANWCDVAINPRGNKANFVSSFGTVSLPFQVPREFLTDLGE